MNPDWFRHRWSRWMENIQWKSLKNIAEMKMAAATAVITATARTTTVNTKYINNYNCNNINNYNSKCNISNKCKSSNIELQQGHEAEVHEASFVSQPVQHACSFEGVQALNSCTLLEFGRFYCSKNLDSAHS